MAAKDKPVRRRSPGQKAGGGDDGGNANDWLTTYCDMVTLLFAFFVLLFALSQVDEGKFDVFVFAMTDRGATADQITEFGQMFGLFVDENASSPDDPAISLPSSANNMEEAFMMIIDQIASSGMSDLVTAYLGDDFIFIRFLDETLFAPNSSIILPQNMQLLNHIGMSLRAVEDYVGMIRIDGHTATIPGYEGTFQVSDRDLSSQRANSVLRYFEDVVGVRGDRLSASSFGRFRPIAGNHTEEERRLNRRIEIMVTESDAVALQLDSIYERMAESGFFRMTESGFFLPA